MPPSVQDRIRLSLKDPYLWMVRGVIGLAGILYTPWMLALLPIGELMIQTWFEHLFKSKLEAAGQTQRAQREAVQLGALAKDDRAWYSRVTAAIGQIKEGLADSAYRGRIDLEAVAQDFYRRIVSLRRFQEAEKETQESALAAEMATQKKALEAETDSKVRDALTERLALLKQRLDLKQKVGARTRQMEAQLRLIEDQVLLLRDTALSTDVRDSDHAAAGTKDSGRNVGEDIEVLSRQLRICSELDDEMQSMLQRSPTGRTREG